MTRQLKLDLSILHDLKLVSHLDYDFAKTMADAFYETTPLVLVSCALVSKALADLDKQIRKGFSSNFGCNRQPVSVLIL